MVVAKAQELVVKLLENMHNLSNGPLFPLVYYLVSQTNTALVGQEPLGLVSKGPIQRAKVVLWILSDRYPTNSVATNVLSRIEGLRPELGGYMKQLRAGEIDEIKGVQEPQLELWQLYEKKSLKPK